MGVVQFGGLQSHAADFGDGSILARLWEKAKLESESESGRDS